MSYRISYGQEFKAPRSRSRRRIKVPFIALCLLLVCCAILCIAHEDIDALRQVVLPWSSPAVTSAFDDFTRDVKEGQPFVDAFTAFCVDILQQAEQNE